MRTGPVVYRDLGYREMVPEKVPNRTSAIRFFVLALLSFIAVVDMDDQEAVDLANQNKCEPVFVWQLHKDNPRAKRYIFYYAPDEAFDNLKTAGQWYADPVKDDHGS